jgi:phosphatidylglycerophosphate synthase
VNLPTLITVARIALAPVVAGLALVPSATVRFGAFVLYLVVAVSDYWDGHLARTRGEVSDLGKVLDPLADKLFLVCVLAAMYVLQAPASESLAWQVAPGQAGAFPYRMPMLDRVALSVPLPLWIILVVLAREAVMTVFRSLMQKRGIVIGASRSAKWKTGFQFTWMGAAYFWFFLWTWAAADRWDTATTGWVLLSGFNAVVGVGAMAGAVVLTFWSLGEYFVRYGSPWAPRRPAA